jgi:hypothetical protein
MFEDVTSNLWGNQTEKFYVFYQNSKFDQICSHVYFSGELENWWEQNTEDQYKAKAQCIIDQEPLL